VVGQERGVWVRLTSQSTAAYRCRPAVARQSAGHQGEALAADDRRRGVAAGVELLEVSK
jgi:hypothetical protein